MEGTVAGMLWDALQCARATTADQDEGDVLASILELDTGAAVAPAAQGGVTLNVAFTAAMADLAGRLDHRWQVG